jgi:DNA-binding GntR family transcriptional regulator
VAGTLAAGAKIAEQATAERLGVSRVPVREATIALERDGLLVRSPTGRLRVATLTERDMAEILEVRRFIEPEVVRLAAERHRPDDIAALERNLAGLRAARDLARVSLCDAEFHDLVAAASHQPRLIQVWDLLRGQFLLWIACSQRRLGRTAEDIRRTTLAHHTAMVGLVRARDARGAERYVRNLLESAAAEVLQRDAPGRV